MSSQYQDACQHLPPNTVEQGAALLLAEAVNDCQVSDSGEVLSGVVEAAGQEASRVYIQISSRSFLGECSCDQGEDCEHVAALLLYADKMFQAKGHAEPVSQTLSSGDPAYTLDTKNSMLDKQEPASRQSALPFKQQCLIFRIDYQAHSHSAIKGAGEFWLSVDICTRVDDGRYQFAPFSLSANSESYPRYVSELDRTILKQLRPMLGKLSSNHCLLNPKQDIDLLKQCLSSQRCIFNEPNSSSIQALSQGPELAATLEWHYLNDGCQQLSLLADQVVVFASQNRILYIDRDQTSWGEVSSSFVEELAALAERQAISPEQTQTFAQYYPSISAPSITPLAFVDQSPVEPVVKCCVEQGVINAQLHFMFNNGELATTFCGGDDGKAETLKADDCRQYRYIKNDTAIVVTKDQAAEQRWQTLFEQHLDSLRNGSVKKGSLNPHLISGEFFDSASYLRFYLRTLPQLRSVGFKHRVSSDFPYRIYTVDEWYGQVNSKANTKTEANSDSWFSFELGVRVNDDNINLFPYLKSLLKKYGVESLLEADLPELELMNGQLIFESTENTFILLPLEKIQRIVQNLLELTEQKNVDKTDLQLPNSQVFRFHLFEDILNKDDSHGLSWKGDTSLLELAQSLAKFNKIELCSPPSDLHASLRGYQCEGLSWLQFLRRYQLGGILADDMGLGKTIQTIAHLLSEKKAGRLSLPALIVAPTSVLSNWRRELERFAPSLKVALWHGNKRQQLKTPFASNDVIITSYTLLHIDAEHLLNQSFSLVILDEAQSIKNPRTKVRQAARDLKAQQRLCLSGTPVENHLGELWSLFDFVQPGLLGNQQQFGRLYKVPIEKYGQQQRLDDLAKRVAPFILRRTKSQVAADLPEKTEIIHRLTMGERQRELYDSLRLSMHQQLRQMLKTDNLNNQRIAVLDMLLKLRQVCCHPNLIKQTVPLSLAEGEEGESVKMAFLLEKLPEMIEEGRRVLIFSQFTSVLDLIAAGLKTLSLPYLMLTGKTKNREALVNSFQNEEVPLFLISLKAGGTGLNLTAADTVIHYDPWWNPAVENQASDRAHRIGQDKPVFVYKLVTENTVEEKIIALHEKKQMLSAGIMTDKASAPLSLGAEDFDYLLQA